jgi:protein O-GlcNAc transferase
MLAKITRKVFSIKTPHEKALAIVQQDKKLYCTGALDPIIAIINNFDSLKRPIAATYCEVANFILNIGQPELAQHYFKLSLKAAKDPIVYSQYLQCVLMSPAATDKIMHQTASAYNKLFLRKISPYQTHTNLRDPNKKLNVGYVCHFFHNSVSQSLLIPFLKAHNRQRIKVFCYSDTLPGEVTDNIKQIADTWHDTKALTDNELTALIQKDQIDILLELNGHCSINRYRVIARKPAPVQISFYNHCATTGISAIDYNLLGDEINIDKKETYTESVYLLKGVSGTAIFPNDFPDCAPPPCLKNPYITFGSFGGAHKINYGVIKAWCNILKAMPNAQFYMKASVLSFPPFINAYQTLFANEGIDPERVRLEGYSEHRQMLQCYADVDIALDSFPYAAGTTTMEALWMGVPVITLAGKTFSSQNGAAILTSINHPELVARSENEYISKALELAANKQRLVSYREQLRHDFQQSPRSNASAFAAKLEDAYVDMWQKYCNKFAVTN